MKLSDLGRIEQDKQRIAVRDARRARRNRQTEFPASVKDAGLVSAMTPEERHAWFEKIKKESGL